VKELHPLSKMLYWLPALSGWELNQLKHEIKLEEAHRANFLKGLNLLSKAKLVLEEAKK